jgi:hypothetical protein
LDLARWLTRPEHPLTSRVWVNRLWQHLFGRGLVSTPNDFGTRGSRPSHPELLDWLALQFTRGGWKSKPILRMLVLSNTYRQGSSCRPDAKGLESDPENRLLWRMNRKRLEGEAIRDSVLIANGRLNREQGGPSIKVPLEPEVYDLIFTEDEPAGLWAVTKDSRQWNRRSLYLFGKRNVRLPIFEAFDQPDRLSPCPERVRSTFAPQSLVLMNGPFLLEESTRLAEAIWTKKELSQSSAVKQLYRRAYSRKPTESEVQSALEFLGNQKALVQKRMDRAETVRTFNTEANLDKASLAAWADLCLAILNSNEFVYIP